MSCTKYPVGLPLILVVFLAGPVLVGPVFAGGDMGQAPTVPVRLLTIEGPLASPRAEVSGMTWQGDTLVILPQYPDRFAEDGMLGIFALRKQVILDALDAEDPAPIEPRLVKCHAPGLAGIVRGFNGLEAVGCMDDRYYMTVEAKDDTGMAGYLVTGHYDLVDGLVIMDLNRLTSIPLGLNIFNIAEEAIIIDGQRVITLSEANGANLTPEPKAKVFNADAEFIGLLPMPHVEYRLTDATALDDEGRFWVMNYYFPPERRKLDPAPDPELERFGDPAAYDPEECVERLLELQLTEDDRIVRTDTPPVNLELLPDRECRNWEALVRLDDRGFLLMTDKFPGTLLAFVPFQE